MKKPSFIKRFLSFLLRLAVVGALMAAFAVITFEGVTYYLTGTLMDVDDVNEKMHAASTQTAKETEETTPAEIDNGNLEATLLFVDSQDGCYEYIMLSLYNKESKALDLVLLPENASMKCPDEKLVREIKKKLPEARESISFADVCKVYGEDRYDMLSKLIGKLCGLEIDAYDILTLDQLAEVIDAADDVSYNLDYAISYRDSDNKLKTLEGGNLRRDGRESVAILTYLDGSDSQISDRLERTSTYLNSYIGKVSGKKSEKTAKKFAKLAKTSRGKDLTSVEDILKNISGDTCLVRIAQGSEKEGIFSLDYQKIQLQLSALIKQSDSLTADSSSSSSSSDKEEESVKSSKNCSIEIYNSAYVSGLAAGWQAYLESEGYTISMIDNYQDEGPISQTRIRVTEEGMGEDLLEYFPDADLSVVDSISTGGDIRIYVGTDYTDVPEVTNYSNEEDEEYEDEDVSEDTSDDSSYDDSSDSDDSSDDSGETDDPGSYDFDTDSE